MPSWIWVLECHKPRNSSSTQQRRELMPKTLKGQPWGQTHIPGVSGMQTFIFYKPWHSMRRTLPMSGWKWCGVRKSIVAAVGSAVAQAAPWSCLLAASTCSFLVWERNPLSLLHWHYFGYPKSGSCSPEAQVHPCAAGQQCHLGTLPRTGRFAKIRDSVHIFILPQYHWVYATQENFLKPELPTVLPQLGVRL